ncbi:short-chain dehydrogenase/reductase SDR [Apiospora saccharicola]|uniref:Short-chain dehydrogenase/reductase SDR n=1 Tax=Apiospora saccharicola TaxID=335842 RepID=A0ABR1UQA5_9PEZI
MAAFAARACSELDRLDIVLLSAGVKNLEFVRSKTGHESNVQLTSPFCCCQPYTAPQNRLHGPHAASPSSPSRCTSGRPLPSVMPPRSCSASTRNEESRFKRGDMERYNTSKLLNVIWTREISSRTASQVSGGSGTVTINAVNPDFCASALHRSHTMPGQALISRVLAWTPAQGGHCLADAACRHDGERGAYISEQEIKAPSSFVTSADGGIAQKRLWEETIALLKEVDPSLDIKSLLEG